MATIVINRVTGVYLIPVIMNMVVICTNKTGCKPGRQHVDPWKCDIVCASGTFGNNCLGKCHCLNQACYPEDGTCPAGECQRGYEGSTCSTECSLGYYGFNCIQSCNGCLADACDKENDTCNNTSECKPGWQDGHLKCDKGTFGINCSEKCHCVNQPCNKSTGTCPTGGCQRGYKENACSTEFSSGNHGFNCDKSCDGCLSNYCDREFGFCTNTSGCKPGRLPSGTHERLECDTDCNNGTFGDGCQFRCYCQSGFCDKISGIYPDKLCQPGWIGNSCSEACDDGFYGDGCATRCYCESEVCNKATGKCSHERCQRGWMGASCSEDIEDIKMMEIQRNNVDKNRENSTMMLTQTMILSKLRVVEGTLASNTETHFEDTILSDQDQQET